MEYRGEGAAVGQNREGERVVRRNPRGSSELPARIVGEELEEDPLDPPVSLPE